MLYGGVLCKTGLRRESNQDRAELFLHGDTALCLIADGMGGHYAGERASEALRQAFSVWWSHYQRENRQFSLAEAEAEFKQILNNCSRDIHQGVPNGCLCGSTVALLWIAQNQYLLMTAGDSRCYHLAYGLFKAQLRQLNRDDVYHAKRIEDRFFEGKLTNAVGIESSVNCSVQAGSVHAGEGFFLCSDGIYKCLNDAELKNSIGKIKAGKNIRAILEQLDSNVIAKGAPDNYSSILIWKESEGL